MSARVCIDCGKPAESPMLPLCLAHDLARLERGETADVVLARVALAEAGADLAVAQVRAIHAIHWEEGYKAAIEAAAKACEVFERGYEHGANANKEGSNARKLMVERADVAKACARRIRMIPAPTMPGKDGGQ